MNVFIEMILYDVLVVVDDVLYRFDIDIVVVWYRVLHRILIFFVLRECVVCFVSFDNMQQ